MAKKLTAIILAISLLFTAFAIPSFAADETSSTERGFYRFVDGLLDAVVSGITSLIFEPHEWTTKDKYESENFYEGHKVNEFLNEPAEGAAWSLGYANASLLTGKELEEEHYVGGSLSVTKKLATDVRDDQKVRTIAVSDGRGISIFAVLDSFGLANNEVRVIREKFQEYADAKGFNITSINISCLHQHSCVDTFGLNGDIINALFTSSFRNLFGMELPSGKNKNYMENLYKVTVQSMVDAVKDMKSGNLFYGSVDMSEYIKDKRDPKVFDGDLNRIRFVPSDGTRETWLLNLPVHCVGHGAAGTVLTGDYPYYIEKYLNENANANFIQILGAELAITSEYPENLVRDPKLEAEYGDGYAGLAAYGELLGKLACTISNDEPIAPILNIRHKEIFVPVENSIFKLAARGGLLTNEVVKSGLGYEVVTEIGYAEFGTSLAVALIPGELAPEIAYGGAVTAEESWDGTEWNYSAFADVTDRRVIVFGITNDQIGYMMTDNDWRSYLTENEEIVSTGPEAGAIIAEEYLTLYAEIN
ncbi:MAG: hypothetical protein E7547_07010 [Ruminococcaceae bacterium]|nr:hypothetical protein [Oscillospiraceae bacterium]